MKKIIVIGTSGSGKTTLASNISAKTGIEHIELDSIYNQENWNPIETKKFLEIVNRYTEETSWIFCGNYFTRLGLDFWKKADVVIWLDYPFNVVFRRLMRRTLNRGIARHVLWNGNRESLAKSFFSKESVILHMIQSWSKQKKRYDPIFSDNQLGRTKLIRLTNDSEVAMFLETL